MPRLFQIKSAHSPENVHQEAGLLGGYLVAQGTCTEQHIAWALQRQQERDVQGIHLLLGEVLVRENLITAEQLSKALKQQCVNFLSTLSPFFLNLSPDFLARLFDESKYRIYAPRQIIFRQGESSDAVYALLRGSVVLIHRLEEGQEIELDTLRPGSIFGEIGPLTGQSRLVSARSVEQSNLLSIPKAVFLQVSASVPGLNREVFRKWFRSAVDGRVQGRLHHDFHYQELLSHLDVRSCALLIGRSKLARRLQETIRDFAESDQPVLLIGEQGTMKTRIAQAIYEKSLDRQAPFIRFRFDRMPEFLEDFLPEELNPLDKTEILQLGAFFGFDHSILRNNQAPWHGFLRLAQNGVLVISDVAGLKEKVQQQLAGFIKHGSFFPLGSSVPEYASTRLMVTAEDELDLNKDLFACLANTIIWIPPLQSRKKDLTRIANEFCLQAGQEQDKAIHGIDQEAMNKILAYDWPGNESELEGVLQRAVTLSKGQYLSSEDIFISSAPRPEKPSLDLLGFTNIRRFFVSPLYPRILQIGMVLSFALVIILGLWGSPDPDSNVNLLLVWANWEPLLILSCFFLARIWCSLCPMGYLVQWVRKASLPRFKIPIRFHRYGYIIAGFGLGLIFWAQASWDIWNQPAATAWLLLIILGSALLFGLTLQGNIWCRFACPLGMMVGTFARTSIVEIRSNQQYCVNECRGYECATGSGGIAGCRMAKGPFAIDNNQDCTLCGDCIKLCPHRSVRFNLRPPSRELWSSRDGEPAAIIFIPLLWGTQIFRGAVFPHHPEWITPLAVSSRSGQALLLFMAVLLAFLLTGLGMILYRRHGLNSKVAAASAFCLSALPLVYANEIALRLEPLLHRAGDFFQILGNQIGFKLPDPAFRLDLESILILQVVLLVLGIVATVILAGKHLPGADPRNRHRFPSLIHMPYLTMGLCSILLL